MLNKSLVMFDMCFAKFFFHVNRCQSHVREIPATVWQLYADLWQNHDRPWNGARFPAGDSQTEGYEVSEH